MNLVFTKELVHIINKIKLNKNFYNSSIDKTTTIPLKKIKQRTNIQVYEIITKCNNLMQF